MLDFLVVSNDVAKRSSLELGAGVFLPKNNLHRSSTINPDYDIKWKPRQCSSIIVYAWGVDVSPSSAMERVIVDDSGIVLFNGWAVPELSCACFTTAAAARMHANTINAWAGEFMALFIDQNGNGEINRNLLASVQLYVHNDGPLTLISTRPSIIAAYLGKKSLSPDFARWVANYAIPMTRNTIFEGIHFLPPGTSIKIHSGKIETNLPSGDILFSETLAEQYLSNRTSYWDGVYENLINLLRVIEVTDNSIDFPISGGKDSRLLLGLLVGAGYKSRIKSSFTNGPEFSPEVISGKMVADHLGIPHRNVWSGTQTRERLDDLPIKLLQHLFIGEGEISPVDLSSSTRVHNRFSLTGQESGLRNIAGKRDVSTDELLRLWMRIHLGNGDFCGIMTDSAIEACRADITAYVDKAIADSTPFEQLPTRHRVEFRGSRWVSRIWKIHNSVGFSPQVFRSEIITKATYNAGARSRRLEEFHYEMLRRVTPGLVNIPFSGQTWDAELGGIVKEAPPNLSPLVWPDGFTVFSRRGMYGVMQDHWDDIKSFISGNASPAFSSVIDLDKLRNMPAAKILGGHVERLWQVVSLAIFEAIYDFSDLRDKESTDALSFLLLDKLK